MQLSKPETAPADIVEEVTSGGRQEEMHAVRLHAPGDVRYEKVPVPRINPDQVLVKVRAVGICGSDTPRVMEKGTYSYPMTLGHELAGEIVRVGSRTNGLRVGDRVTVIPLIPCGKCSYCAVGSYQLCDDYSYYGSRTDGGLADYIAVQAENALRLPDEVDFETGACTDPAAIALHAIRRAGLSVGETLVVIGTGLIGLFAIQWARIIGAQSVIAVDVFAQKLQAAREVGADYVIDASADDPVSKVMELTDNEGAERVIELAGATKAQEQGIRMAKKRGTIVYCGISNADLVLPHHTVDLILRKELSLKGAWNSGFSPHPIHEWKTVLRHMANGQLISTPAISHRLSLQQTPDIFPIIWNNKEFVHKVMVFPGQALSG